MRHQRRRFGREAVMGCQWRRPRQYPNMNIAKISSSGVESVIVSQASIETLRAACLQQGRRGSGVT
jgi:hypothetical protein